MSTAASVPILRYFPEAHSNEPVTTKLISLASSFAQSPDDLFAKWEVFAMQNQVKTYADVATMNAFQEYLEQTQRSSVAKRQRLTPKTGPRIRFGRIKSEEPLAPATQVQVAAEVLSSVHPEVPNSSESTRVGFTLNTKLADFNQRPFNVRLGDASKELDDEIERVIDLVLAAQKLERSDLVNPAQISQGLGVAVGRIRREVLPIKNVEEAAGQWAAPLAPSSMTLETSRRIGAGARAALDFRMVASHSAELFEGQVVALRGKNPQGDQFIVHEILDLPRLPVARVAAAADAEKEKNITIAIASCSSSPQKLAEFANWTISASVSAVLILGPLLKAEQGTPSNKEQVRLTLRSMRAALGVPIVIIPSSDDAFSIDSVFPQPPVELDVEKPVLPVSNPCTFSLNEVAITAAAVPTLRDIRQPLTKAFQHVLRQRRLYPVYPPPPGVSIDAPRLDLADLGKVAPNVLVLPSADSIKSDAAIVDDVVCVSPASLDNDQAILITVAPGAAPLASRTRVDILKLVPRS